MTKTNMGIVTARYSVISATFANVGQGLNLDVMNAVTSGQNWRDDEKDCNGCGPP